MGESIEKKDWMMIGRYDEDFVVEPGTSHISIRGYPRWGDDKS